MSHVHIPTTYLKHFSNDSKRGRKTLVHCYNKKEEIHQHLPVDKIGIRNNFYSPEMEKYLNIYEKHYNLIKEAIKNNRYTEKINGIHFEHIILCVLGNFLCRSSAYQKFCEKIWNNDPNRKKENEINSKIPYDWFTLQGIQSYMKKGVKNYGILETNNPLLTSDNPLVNFSHRFGNFNIIPISFNEFIIFSNSKNEEEAQKMENELYTLAFNVNVEKLNQKIFEQADTFVIYSNKNNIANFLNI